MSDLPVMKAPEPQVHKPMMCGGHSAPRQPDGAERAICDHHRAEVEVQINAGNPFAGWDIVEMTSQVVAGINYAFTVAVGDGNTLKMTVFKPLPCNAIETRLTNCFMHK